MHGFVHFDGNGAAAVWRRTGSHCTCRVSGNICQCGNWNACNISGSFHAIFLKHESPIVFHALSSRTDHSAASIAQDLVARGGAWALLGAARLALVAPAPGIDPAAKYGLQRAHLLRRLAEELAPQLQVCLSV